MISLIFVEIHGAVSEDNTFIAWPVGFTDSSFIVQLFAVIDFLLYKIRDNDGKCI